MSLFEGVKFLYVIYSYFILFLLYFDLLGDYYLNSDIMVSISKSLNRSIPKSINEVLKLIPKDYDM